MTLSDMDRAMSRVPEYDRFMGVDEMYERARATAERHPDLATFQIVGRSTDGEEIPMVRIGNGPQRLLLFASPHPNEPIGGMLIQFLLDELITNEELRSGRSWYLMPCVDPDGTRLNEGWFSGPFTVRNYARHFYRPRTEEQVEWTFPIEYKRFSFNDPISETQALMRSIEQVRPHFMYSLHNAGFGGTFYYVSHELQDVHDELFAIPKSREMVLWLGEPEMPWAEEFAPAIYKIPSTTDAYDYFEEYGEGNPADMIKGGASSVDYLNQLGLRDTVTLITELPYFQAAQLEDQSPTDTSRRQVILEGIDQTGQFVSTMRGLIDRADPHLDPGSRLYRSVTAFVSDMARGLESKRRWAETSAGMDQPATVAQQADEAYLGTFYRLLVAAILRRALEAQLVQGANPTLERALTELEEHLERWVSMVEENLRYTAIPIKKLVEVQYGAMLAVLKSEQTPRG